MRELVEIEVTALGIQYNFAVLSGFPPLGYNPCFKRRDYRITDRAQSPRHELSNVYALAIHLVLDKHLVMQQGIQFNKGY